MKTDLFQSCGHCWVFQICWHIECSTFTAPSFRIWNGSTRIPSPPVTLFVVMIPKAHLTSHSRMSGSGWVITSSWLSGSWRSFLYSSSVYSCHLFIIMAMSNLERVHVIDFCIGRKIPYTCAFPYVHKETLEELKWLSMQGGPQGDEKLKTGQMGHRDENEPYIHTHIQLCK